MKLIFPTQAKALGTSLLYESGCCPLAPLGLIFRMLTHLPLWAVMLLIGRFTWSIAVLAGSCPEVDHLLLGLRDTSVGFEGCFQGLWSGYLVFSWFQLWFSCEFFIPCFRGLVSVGGNGAYFLSS